ncbi:MAG: hypothetical protein K0R72_174 [Clostridia bacterium]|jgi:hypothetical protein|nr:hypothetical protein [Clostridia bacterium]
MSDKLFRKAEIKQAKDRYCNVSTTVCVIGIVGIILSPSIPLTIAIAAVTSSIGYAGLKKIQKLNDEEKKL